MADLVNPYANPYLPSFISQRPVVNTQPNQVTLPQPQMNLSGMAYSQIHSVKGFEGADNYNLANGASEILAEEDPNLARIYIVAKDTNGQKFVQGFNLVPVERPKEVTMDDLSTTMNRILERLDKLEGDRGNDQSVHANPRKQQWPNGTNSANGRSGQVSEESTANSQSNAAK